MGGTTSCKVKAPMAKRQNDSLRHSIASIAATASMSVVAGCTFELQRVERSRVTIGTVDTSAVDVVSDARTDSGVSRSRAGSRCTEDRECEPLTCDRTVLEGLCTATTCYQTTSQANEAAQCGGIGATCLTEGDGAQANAYCLQACVPSTFPSCRPGHVCTGFWYTHRGGMPDSPGCFPFCAEDAHCNAGERCNERTGKCQMAVPNPALLADGQPCRIPSPMDPSPCKGLCLRVVTGNPIGLCGSFVDLARTTQCPDDPMAIQPLGRTGMDNLGVCIFRRCSATQCCPAGLVCEGEGDPGTCSVDDPLEPNVACDGDGGMRDATSDGDASDDVVSEGEPASDGDATSEGGDL